MALPSSFEDAKSYFEECVMFLEDYQYLFNFRNTDILVNKVLDRIDIKNLVNIDVFDDEFELPSDEFLDSFFTKLQRLKVIHEGFLEVNDLESLVHVPLSPKKRHEIVYLAKEVKGVCEENKCQVVVDFGSGLGYLDQIIFETTNLKVLGLECNTSHYTGAKKRQGKYHPDSLQNVKYIRHTVSGNSNVQIEEFIHDKFSNCNGFCITGLHACADLTVVALDLFLKMAEAKATVIMPCCYHKMERDGDKFKNFPLSNSLKNVFETSERPLSFLDVPFLRLGAQPPSMDEKLEDSVFNLLARAVLQLYASRHNCSLKRNKRKAVKMKTLDRNFENYIHNACTGFRLSLNNESTGEVNKVDNSARNDIDFDLDELKSIWRELSDSIIFKKAAVFVLLQNCLQPVIENLILYDRLVYLMEKGLQKCRFKKIVNETISPRCLALFACK